MTGRLITQ